MMKRLTNAFLFITLLVLAFLSNGFRAKPVDENAKGLSFSPRDFGLQDDSVLKPHDLRLFFKNKKRLLSRWKDDFKKAGQIHNISWTLIAAISYQESHWDEHARSYTGVRGLMQLTEDTAAHMGVTDRKDPQQSIFGGARYFRYLLDLTPKQIPLEERVSLALTAYNLGWGHLMDAQNLAVKKGLNPGSWRHLYGILPLLANPTYASQLQYGHARGQEAQDFVERVKAFEHLLRITDLR